MAPCYTKQQRKKKKFFYLLNKITITIYLTEKENYF